MTLLCVWRFETEGTFSNDSGADASESLENLEEMFPRYS